MVRADAVVGEAGMRRVLVLDRTSMLSIAKEMRAWGRHYNQAVHALNIVARYLRGRGDADEAEIADALLSARAKLGDVEDGYSWVADIRERVKTARALACDEEGFRSLLGALGVEVSLNSPNARRRDYLYALSDRPTRKVGGEKLGRQYGKRALEFEWACGPPFEEEKLAEILEHAILVRDLEELGEMARAMGTIKDFGFVAIDSIDRAIAQLENLAGDPGGRRGAADATEMLERVRHARRFAAEFGVLPVREPMSVFVGRGERSSTTWGDSSSYSHDASSQEHHIDHDRGDYAR